MIKLNKATYLDKVHACWIGKNIGGTIGAPFEGKREMQDVKGFSSRPGTPLPNDDLDLQLVWLTALECEGVKNFSTNTLAEYWLERISPDYNEYGIGKTNLAMGILPPMSGEVDNDRWKTSNGAWIRSEIWAALAPGVSDTAVKYAVMDAMVDHGLSEGTYAEIYTASLESSAYTENDINKLIETALEKIPSDCKTAQTIRLAIECYNEGISLKDARERIVEFNTDFGWFQAPANLGFVTLGLLYGEGDFKKSVISAINCGDDTDCTGATVGAIMGIIGGTAAIPEDWREYIGGRIVTVCIDGSYAWSIPGTCGELTERVARLVPEVMKANGVSFELTDGETEIDKDYAKRFNQLTAADFLNFSPYSYDILDGRSVKVKVELDASPRVKPGDTRRVKLSFKANNTREQRKLHMRLILPEGWTCGRYDKTVMLEYPQMIHKILGTASTEFTICAGENVDAVNRAYMEITCGTIPRPIMVPIVFMG